MIIYIESKAFPLKTFVLSVAPNDPVARVRAHLMHILYEIGRENHQFRLRYGGQYLRDSLSVDDYEIHDNAIVKMVPLAKRSESALDVQSLSSSVWSADEGAGQPSHVMDALLKEIKMFDTRERRSRDLRSVFYVLGLALFFSLLTTAAYSAAWLAPVCLFGFLLCPKYSRLAGFIGRAYLWRTMYCAVYSVASFSCAVASAVLATLEWVKITNHGCGARDGGELDFSGDCDHKAVFTAIFFSIHCLVKLVSFGITVHLFYNFRLESGDLIEEALVQTRDVPEVLDAARKGRPREVRLAAYELASLAASGDDTKFRIVAEGGLSVLNTLAMSRDEATQEHSAEALAELLTVPAIQDEFMTSIGPLTLTSLVLSTNQAAVCEAAEGLTYIAAENEENKIAITQEHGLRDICQGARASRSGRAQRALAGLLLELVFSPHLRSQMAAMLSPAQSLLHLCKSRDLEAQRFALQALELLALTSGETVTAQDSALDVLLGLTSRGLVSHLWLLAAKILLYYTDDTASCAKLIGHPLARDALDAYGRSGDAILQKVVAKIVFCAAQDPSLRRLAEEKGLADVAGGVRDEARDPEARNMAAEAMRALSGETSSIMGSRASLRSLDPPPRPSPRKRAL